KGPMESALLPMINGLAAFSRGLNPAVGDRQREKEYMVAAQEMIEGMGAISGVPYYITRFFSESVRPSRGRRL
ncbi:MAG: hypothetical protein ACR2P5_07705, partial [Gammaproteobacteria bacterium]